MIDQSIVNLAVEGGGIMAGPEEVEEGGVGADGGIELEANDLDVVGLAGADKLVGGVTGMALGESHLRLGHTMDPLEGKLHPPEAACGKLGKFMAGDLRRVQIRGQCRIFNAMGSHG